MNHLRPPAAPPFRRAVDGRKGPGRARLAKGLRGWLGPELRHEGSNARLVSWSGSRETQSGQLSQRKLGRRRSERCRGGRFLRWCASRFAADRRDSRAMNFCTQGMQIAIRPRAGRENGVHTKGYSMRGEWRKIEARAVELMRGGMVYLDAHRQADGDFVAAPSLAPVEVSLVWRGLWQIGRCRHHGGLSTGARTPEALERLEAARQGKATGRQQMGEGISNTGKHMKEPREPKEYRYELVNKRDGWTGKFETMYAALAKADVRRPTELAAVRA